MCRRPFERVGRYVCAMSAQERVLVSHQDAEWLPAQGRADVVLAGGSDVAPAPVCLVRLLVTRGDHILVEARPDGRGLDIPTRAVRDGAWEEALEDLLRRTVPDGCRRPRLLGYVRNDVPGAPDGYPWPTPHAHFVVWHCRLPADRDAAGAWLDTVRAEAELRERHWWPLAAHAEQAKP